jgi:hypothetical protein
LDARFDGRRSFKARTQFRCYSDDLSSSTGDANKNLFMDRTIQGDDVHLFTGQILNAFSSALNPPAFGFSAMLGFSFSLHNRDSLQSLIESIMMIGVKTYYDL